MVMKRDYKKHLVLLLIVGCIMLCCTGCSSGGEEFSNAAAELPHTEAETDSENPVREKETTEAEKIESVYGSSIDMTFCIFTSNGNNGTGFLYEDEYVITNAHVLYDAGDFTFLDAEGGEHKGTVVFTDNETDIAIIRVDNYQGGSVRFGNSDAVSAGEQVILIGNPVGGVPFSFCTGKRVEPEETFYERIDPQNRYIPVDANIVSGYSGGPVFNLCGELIGISNATYVGDLTAYEFDYLSFIIPINSVKEQIETNCG